MIVIGDKSDDKSYPGPPSPIHDDGRDQGIKCRYMRAAHGYLSNTTFHGIAWVVEDVPRATKVPWAENRMICQEEDQECV